MGKLTPYQMAHALMTLYAESYKEKYGTALLINRHRLSHSFRYCAEDLGYDNARAAITFFFECDSPNRHPVERFLNIYDELHKNRIRLQEDEEKRRKLREQTAKRVAEMERKMND